MIDKRMDGFGVNDQEILGLAICQARKRRGLSLADMSSLTNFSKSVLQRMEAGERKVAARDVERIDDALEAGGQLKGLCATIQGRQQLPPFSAFRSTLEASHRWPAPWAGAVWVLVEAAQAGQYPTDVALQWGPWQFDATIDKATLFETHKAPDDISVAIGLRTSLVTDVVFGAGPRPQSNYVFEDIRSRWF
ncbi:helix-turn-helix domain-containing protein [Clavibacter michiganensis]|uniref:helix-turn-helix domain-containing protein n=1 Tax=Clavibacter michiganensis TaxID=28447 RepID=UPI001303A757|nr:helix-turn-helix transcriptional regulator [Clavibacter michiganensis]